MAATALLRLAKLTGSSDLFEAARSTLEAAVGVMQQSPMAAGQMLVATDMLFGPTKELAIVASTSEELQAVAGGLHQRFVPNRVLAGRHAEQDYRSPHLDPMFEGKEEAASGEPLVFVCENFACQAPARGSSAIDALWNQLANASDSA